MIFKTISDNRLISARNSSAVLTGLFLIGVLSSFNAESASQSDGGERNSNCDEIIEAKAASTQEPPVYNPPRLGAPKTRVGGGTRNSDSENPSIELLAPISTGLTTQAMPTLYWHLSDDYAGMFEFVVVELKSVQTEPIFRKQVSQTLCAGFHALNLREHEVRLLKDQTYQWSVVIVRDATRRSRDIVAHATLERVNIPDNIQQTPQHLADKGFWYDAIEAINPTIKTTVNQADVLSLMKQVGLEVLTSN